MTNPIESVVVLSRALDQTGDVLTAVHQDQLALPTPCGEWDVARLIAHVVATPGNFIKMARGDAPDWSAEPPPIGHDWAARFRNRSACSSLSRRELSTFTPSPSASAARPSVSSKCSTRYRNRLPSGRRRAKTTPQR